MPPALLPSQVTLPAHADPRLAERLLCDASQGRFAPVQSVGHRLVYARFIEEADDFSVPPAASVPSSVARLTAPPLSNDAVESGSRFSRGHTQPPAHVAPPFVQAASEPYAIATHSGFRSEQAQAEAERARLQSEAVLVESARAQAELEQERARRERFATSTKRLEAEREGAAARTASAVVAAANRTEGAPSAAAQQRLNHHKPSDSSIAGTSIYVPKAGVQAELTVGLVDYDTLINDAARLAGFKQEIVTEMARGLGKLLSEIQITSLRAGSVIVGVFIDEAEPVRAAALEAEVRSGPLSKQIGKYPVSAVVAWPVKGPDASGRSPRSSAPQTAAVASQLPTSTTLFIERAPPNSAAAAAADSAASAQFTLPTMFEPQAPHFTLPTTAAPQAPHFTLPTMIEPQAPVLLANSALPSTIALQATAVPACAPSEPAALLSGVNWDRLDTAPASTSGPTMGAVAESSALSRVVFVELDGAARQHQDVTDPNTEQRLMAQFRRVPYIRVLSRCVDSVGSCR